MTKNETGAGRPKKPDHDGTSEGRALANLQYRFDRAATAVHDHQTLSVAAAIGRAAKAGVSADACEKVIEALEATVADLRQAAERAYAAPEPEPVYESRISLVE